MKRIMINDICEVYDGPHATPTKTEKGPVYLGIDAITEDGMLDETRFSHLSEDDYYKWTKRIIPQKNDIVFSYEATLGRYAMIPEDFYGCLGRRLAIIRNVSDRINTKWLYYYFKSPEWTGFIKNQTVKGSTVDRISIEDFPQYTVPLIPIHNQNKIVDVLDKIDCKIVNNRKINDYLDEMAKTIYDYWFVQFDFPDENGKPYKSSGGKMKYSSELDMNIPISWDICTLKNHHTIDRGISYTSKDISEGTGTPMINLACIDINRNYRDGQLKYYNKSVPTDKCLTGNELLIACTDLTRNADIVGSPILVPKISNEMTYSMDMAKLNFDSNLFDKFYLYMTLRTEYYHNFIKKYASGTNVLHLNLDGLNWYTMWLPPLRLQYQFGDIINKIQAKKNEVLYENNQLAYLRDWLLPMLMNGQATIEN